MEKRLPIKWYYPEDLITRYVTNLIVQHGEQEFIVSFFEILPPAILGTPEQQEAQLERIDDIQATCVARIVIPAEKMSIFVKALQDNLDKFLSKMIDDDSE
ncbi:MAG: DUF3467 domain-containing protein [Chloroflexi bacterium]|nr:DUF3467 domain-containing protein [Chloroflexota bacterium]